MAFEIFENQKYCSDTNLITIRPTGQFGLSRGIAKRFDLKKYKFCTLLYDKTVKSIGFLFHKDFRKGCLPVRAYNKNGFVIQAKSFFNFYGIKLPEKAVSYEIAIDSFENKEIIKIIL